MTTMELIIASIVAFASTNIDDIFILMLFFGNKSYKTRNVVIGQYLGIGTLIAISFIGSFASLFINGKYIGLLGLLPVFLGIKSLIAYFRKKKMYAERSDQILVSQKRSSVLSVAAVTFANGGDNIGIYIPLFSTLILSGKLIMTSIFLLMVAVWCYAGWHLSRHPAIAKIIDRYGHIVTPVVLIALGLYILHESGSFTLFTL
jgi:cadmium resistance transport/sequestration family protein